MGDTQTASGVQTITKDELAKRLGEVQVVNVLAPNYYNLGFIQGSKKIPLAELETRLGELDKSKEVVTYCAGVDCSSSSKAAKLLAEKGFKVKAYEGGIKEWTEAGLPQDQKKEHGSGGCCTSC